MLAMRHLSTERFAGGILAVANHIANFCDSVDVISALGEATAAESEFLAAHISKNVNATFIHRKDAPTIVKRRFVDSYFFTKMLEIYEMNPCVLCDEDNAELCKTLGERITDYDLVIAFDFGHGLFTPRSIDLLCSSAPYFAVNVQANAGNLGYNTISRYRRADFICIAENEMRLEARDRTSDLTDVVLNVAGRINVSKVIATQGKLGCLCFDKTDGIYQVPAFAAQVVDRMGAGDAFFSIAALCGAQGAPIEMIGFVGNAVAAHAVATVGHRESVDRASLIKHVESLLK
jgi:bifunctional ADP-heptose synthase (sugar kinase/adenylyltransferase)